MAILKHIASKNADYRAAFNYLVYQHDEFTQKPILDDAGRPVLRIEYYLDSLLCHPLEFARHTHFRHHGPIPLVTFPTAFIPPFLVSGSAAISRQAVDSGEVKYLSEGSAS